MKRIVLLVVISLITASFLFGASQSEGAAEEKVLRYPTMAENLDPASQGSGTFPELSIIYENLARYKANSTELEPWLAKSWTISADGTEITFFLREGVQFHGGYGEFTAEDVKFSIERIVMEELPEKGEWINLDRVDVVEKYTARIVMKSPTPTLFTTGLPFQAGMIVSKKAVEALGAEAFNSTPVGTGPFELESWEVGEKTVFKRFADYWGTPISNADKIEFLSVPDFFPALEAGEVDINYASSALQFQDARTSDRAEIAGKEMRYWWITLPFNDPVLQNKAARLAFRYAVDVDALVEVGGFGIFDRANTLVPPALQGHWAEAPAYQQDLELSKRYLAEAGYPDGFECTLTWGTTPDPTVELLQEQLAQVGINLKIEQVEGGLYWENLSTGKYVGIPSYQTLPDTGYALVWFTTDHYWNTMKFASDRFDELYEMGQLEVDLDKRAAMHIEMQQIMDEEVAIIPIAFLWNGVVYRKGALDLGPDDAALLPNGVVDLSRVIVL